MVISLHVALAVVSGLLGLWLLVSNRVQKAYESELLLWLSVLVVLTGCVAVVLNSSLSALSLMPHALLYSTGILSVVWWRAPFSSARSLAAHGCAMVCLAVLASARV